MDGWMNEVVSCTRRLGSQSIEKSKAWWRRKKEWGSVTSEHIPWCSRLPRRIHDDRQTSIFFSLLGMYVCMYSYGSSTSEQGRLTTSIISDILWFSVHPCGFVPMGGDKSRTWGGMLPIHRLVQPVPGCLETNRCKTVHAALLPTQRKTMVSTY